MQGGPAGCMYSVSDSGWMESVNLYSGLKRFSFLQLSIEATSF